MSLPAGVIDELDLQAVPIFDAIDELELQEIPTHLWHQLATTLVNIT